MYMKIFASHLKFIFFIGMAVAFSLHILFLFENLKKKRDTCFESAVAFNISCM